MSLGHNKMPKYGWTYFSLSKGKRVTQTNPEMTASEGIEELVFSYNAVDINC